MCTGAKARFPEFMDDWQRLTINGSLQCDGVVFVWRPECEGNRKSFNRHRQSLVDHGFIECVDKAKGLYRPSDAWKTYELTEAELRHAEANRREAEARNGRFRTEKLEKQGGPEWPRYQGGRNGPVFITRLRSIPDPDPDLSLRLDHQEQVSSESTEPLNAVQSNQKPDRVPDRVVSNSSRTESRASAIPKPPDTATTSTPTPSEPGQEALNVEEIRAEIRAPRPRMAAKVAAISPEKAKKPRSKLSQAVHEAAQGLPPGIGQLEASAKAVAKYLDTRDVVAVMKILSEFGPRAIAFAKGIPPGSDALAAFQDRAAAARKAETVRRQTRGTSIGDAMEGLQRAAVEHMRPLYAIFAPEFHGQIGDIIAAIESAGGSAMGCRDKAHQLRREETAKTPRRLIWSLLRKAQQAAGLDPAWAPPGMLEGKTWAGAAA